MSAIHNVLVFLEITMFHIISLIKMSESRPAALYNAAVVYWLYCENHSVGKLNKHRVSAERQAGGAGWEVRGHSFTSTVRWYENNSLTWIHRVATRRTRTGRKNRVKIRDVKAVLTSSTD